MNDFHIEKEKIINNYLSDIDYKNINPDQITSDLKNLLGEEPAIRLNYITNNVILEDGKSQKKQEIIESVTIFYTVDVDSQMTDPMGRAIPIPIPRSKTFHVD